MPRSNEWFRPFYAVVRTLFILIEDGEWHKPYPMLKQLRMGDQSGLRGFRQKELERLLFRGAGRGKHIERRFHAKGWEFRLASVPDIRDLKAPKRVPKKIREDARFQGLVDSFEAARSAIKDGGDPEAALRAFNGYFPHETRAMRALSEALRIALQSLVERVRSDPGFAGKLQNRGLVPSIATCSSDPPGVRAHALVQAVVSRRAEFTDYAQTCDFVA